MKESDVIEIIKEAFDRMSQRMGAGGADNEDFLMAFSTVIGVSLDTISENINDRVAIETALKVLQKFVADKPHITLMLHSTQQGKSSTH